MEEYADNKRSRKHGKEDEDRKKSLCMTETLALLSERIVAQVQKTTG